MKKQALIFAVLGASVVALSLAQQKTEKIPAAVSATGVTLFRQAGGRLMASIAAKSLLGIGAVWTARWLCTKGYEKANLRQQ